MLRSLVLTVITLGLFLSPRVSYSSEDTPSIFSNTKCFGQAVPIVKPGAMSTIPSWGDGAMGSPLPSQPPPNCTGGTQLSGQGGYAPAWHSTPSEAEVGMDGERFFQSQWQRVIRMGADPPGFSFNTARAPDGTPALKGVIKKGGSYSQHVMGNQLGPTGKGDHVLASFQWYTPCSGGQMWNQQNGTYIGFGVWGSADGVNTFPGGSVNNVNNIAWNFRVALSKSNTYGAYAYLPGNTGSGQFWSTGVKPSCDRWEQIDLEIIQNDIGKSNGEVRLYVNCKLIREETGVRTRVNANVRPKGFHMLLRHNSGALQDETYYWRHFSLFTK